MLSRTATTSSSTRGAAAAVPAQQDQGQAAPDEEPEAILFRRVELGPEANSVAPPSPPMEPIRAAPGGADRYDRSWLETVTVSARRTPLDTAVLSGEHSLGCGVAVSGDTVVAGASGADIGANRSQGAAYVFVKPASGWADATETAKLTASDGAADEGLGLSVAVSGDTVVAGADATIGANPLQGAAYVFVKPASGWANATETTKLTASDGAAVDFLGGSVGISGDTVVAGAFGATIGANRSQGAAYVFGPSPTDLIRNLISDVESLGLPKGSANSFVVKLNDAIAALNAGDLATACADLQDFINEVNAQTQPPTTKLLTPAQAKPLIDLAQQIKAAIGCP